MKFLSTILIQTSRNLQKTWPSQFMTLLTVSLSVLIFSFFFLIYINIIKAGESFGDDLRLTIYLEEEPVVEMQVELVRKITNFKPLTNLPRNWVTMWMCLTTLTRLFYHHLLKYYPRKTSPA